VMKKISTGLRGRMARAAAGADDKAY